MFSYLVELIKKLLDTDERSKATAAANANDITLNTMQNTECTATGTKTQMPKMQTLSDAVTHLQMQK